MLYYYYKTAKEEEFHTLSSPREGCWIHAAEASHSDLHSICELTGLSIEDIQDSLDRYEVPRLEKTPEGLFFYTRHPVDMEGSLYTTTLTIIFTPQYLITISPSKNGLVKAFTHKKNRLTNTQRMKIFIELLLRITQEFTIQTRRVRHNVLTQQKEMIHVESDDISELTRHEEVLNQYLSSLVPFRASLENLLSGKYLTLAEKDKEQIEDVLNAVKQSEDLCTIVTKTIRSLRNSFQIIFTNNLNKTIKLLTAITIIVTIPTMIASIYGMNVALPYSQSSHAFSVLIGLIVVLSVTCCYLFRKKGWL